VGSESSESMDAFESWLLRRIAQAVEAGDVPADLLKELQSEIEAAKDLSQEEGHAAALWDIAEIAGIDRDQVAETLAAIEAQPTVTRELLMRRIAEAWLEGQRRAYRSQA